MCGVSRGELLLQYVKLFIRVHHLQNMESTFHLMMVKQMSRKTPSVRVCCRHLFSWPFALNPQIAKLHLFAFHELTIPKNPWHTSGALST